MITVITPTIGTPFLRRCIESVQAQTIESEVEHLIVVDGPEYEETVRAMIPARPHLRFPVHVIVLPRNTGAGGWNGHKIYAGMPFVTETDWIAFLDEDNWYDADHLRGMMDLVLRDALDWCFSLRMLVDYHGDVICPDVCESLGSLSPTCFAPDDRLIDTSCFLMRREVACSAAVHWLVPTTGDRAVTKYLLDNTGAWKHGAYRVHSVMYRIKWATRPEDVREILDRPVPRLID